MKISPESKFLISGMLAILLLGMFVTTAGAMSSKSPQLPCKNPALMQMGDRIFSIPRPGKIYVSYIEPGKINDLCQATAPVNVKLWSSTIYASTVLSYSEDSFDQQKNPSASGLLHMGAVNWVDQKYLGNHKYESVYQHVENLMKLANVSLKDLPVKEGFHVWEKQNRPIIRLEKNYGRMHNLYRNQNIYISEDPRLLSPSGEPAVFACDTIKYANDSYEDCSVTIWDGQIVFAASMIQTRKVPKESWARLYRGLLNLRSSLLSPAIIEQPNGSK